MQTFAALRATRFKDNHPDVKAGLEYLEQLAASTNTNIDSWEIPDDVAISDKRAMNKYFFAKADAKAPEMDAALAAIAPVLLQLNTGLEQRRTRMINEYKENAKYKVEQAIEYYRVFETRIKEGMDQTAQAKMLGDQDTPSFDEELKRCLSNRFWAFHAFDTRTNTIRLITANNVILTELNKKAGVNRRVDMGKYIVAFGPLHAQIKVECGGDNVIGAGARHPYIDKDGYICWGNGSETAAKLIIQGHWCKVLDLLAALLTTYSVDSTPFVSLIDFERTYNRATNPTAAAALSENCSSCDEMLINCECDRCDTCEALSDDCDCQSCSTCDVVYANGENCGGIFCPVCEECTGEDACDDHYCSTCSDFSVRDGECRNGCCEECSHTSDDCDRCRECDQHEGHESGCSNAPEPEGETT